MSLESSVLAYCSRTCAAVVLMAGGVLAPLGATAQPAMSKEAVNVIVPYGPGSGPDIIARQIAPLLIERWGRPVVVENRAGASGIIGTDVVAKAAPDGNTLLLTVNTLTMLPSLYANLPFDIFADFSPVAKVATSSFGLVANAGTGLKTFPEFIGLARERPGTLNYASPGNGTPHHLAMELLKLEQDIDVIHVPYKSLGTALTDTAGGHVEVMFSALPSLLPQIAAGKVTLLGTTGENRSPLTPQTPSLREQGAGSMRDVDAWFAVLAPAGTPPDTIRQLNQDITSVIAAPTLGERLVGQGFSVDAGSPEALQALMLADFERWKDVVAKGGIQAD